MDKVNAILSNKGFIEHLSRNMEYEKDRIFCKHDLQHFLDVARIAYIMTLEKNIGIDKEVVYATALLHDIGRWMQYKEGISHEIASCNLAGEILTECGFGEEEIGIIMSAISNHRGMNSKRNSFNEVFYLSDKFSRRCFTCKAILECNWSNEKKNFNITY